MEINGELHTYRNCDKQVTNFKSKPEQQPFQFMDTLI